MDNHTNHRMSSSLIIPACIAFFNAPWYINGLYRDRFNSIAQYEWTSTIDELRDFLTHSWVHSHDVWTIYANKNSDDDDSRDFSKGLAQQYVDQATSTFAEMDEALSVNYSVWSYSRWILLTDNWISPHFFLYRHRLAIALSISRPSSYAQSLWKPVPDRKSECTTSLIAKHITQCLYYLLEIRLNVTIWITTVHSTLPNCKFTMDIDLNYPRYHFTHRRMCHYLKIQFWCAVLWKYQRINKNKPFWTNTWWCFNESWQIPPHFDYTLHLQILNC